MNTRHAYMFLTALLVAGGLAGCPMTDDWDGDTLPGEGARFEHNKISQDDIANQRVPLLDIRKYGRQVFSTPFNRADGYGDGPHRPGDPPTIFGSRPTLQGNGTFLRLNGLDGQTCLECHSILSNATVPFTFGVGGVGGAVSNAMFQPTTIDMLDSENAGVAGFNGRFINPPFLFGSGGVELLGKEMTRDLQRLKAQAENTPGVDVPLQTKGVSFGVLRYDNGAFDFSRVEGIDADLVVRPFGRKGEFISTREFDLTAMQFHFGMQPVEVFGDGVDADHDGVANEIGIGELSALAIFNTTLERPQQRGASPAVARGEELFSTLGCAVCHVPVLKTESRFLTHSQPEVPSDPTANVFYEVDLSAPPTNFQRTPDGGLNVPLFADLKRHDMGERLAESFGTDLDAHFTTARLWGVADTAPYLHDGRALTIGEAILLHGGEAQEARDMFDGLDDARKADLLTFLRTLRTPASVGADLGAPAQH